MSRPLPWALRMSQVDTRQPTASSVSCPKEHSCQNKKGKSESKAFILNVFSQPVPVIVISNRLQTKTVKWDAGEAAIALLIFWALCCQLLDEHAEYNRWDGQCYWYGCGELCIPAALYDSKIVYIREASWVGIQIFPLAHRNGFWGCNLGWVCFSLITRLPQPKVGTGTRVLRELKRQMSFHFWEDVKGYSRQDMTISLERMKNKLDFLPVTFMKHSFPFVCGDRFLYFPEENVIFIEEGEEKEKVSENVFHSFSSFKDHFLRKQFDEFMCTTAHSQESCTYRCIHSLGLSWKKRGTVNMISVNTLPFDMSLKTWFNNPWNYCSSWGRSIYMNLF